MSIPLPNLDDRTYDDLVQEALSLIPTYEPEWTNHNPSDPGITLIELFAYLTEMLNYRLNRVTDANKIAFLKLINGPKWQQGKPLNEEIRLAVLNLREPKRGISCKDFEDLALEFNKQPEANKQLNQQKVARVHCLPRRDLEFENISLQKDKERPGHISVIIVPDQPVQKNSRLKPTQDLLKAVRDYLEPKRLLTTRLHVVAPRYLAIKVETGIVLKPGAKEGEKDGVRPRVIEALKDFFHPLKGGQEGKGWEFGRNVYISEIYALLDRQPGVDYVTQIKVNGQQSDIELKDNELVDFQLDDKDIKIIYP